jgi:hypothetical protein
MTLGTDLRLALEHYLEMIRRHVLDEDRNREIALKLYQKHQEVFDYIIASVPRLGDIIATACMEVVGERDDVVRLGFPRSFKPAALLGKPVVGEIQGDAARALYFEISIGGEVKLYLYLGPGPAALRERIYAAAGAAGAPFSPKPALTPFWTSLLAEKLVSRTEMKRLSPAEASRLAQERLVSFLDANLVAVALTVLSVVDPDPLPPVAWR